MLSALCAFLHNVLEDQWVHMHPVRSHFTCQLRRDMNLKKVTQDISIVKYPQFTFMVDASKQIVLYIYLINSVVNVERVSSFKSMKINVGIEVCGLFQ